MATSGSTDFSLTAREVVDFALKKLRVVDSGRVAGATDAATAQRELNLMLKGWQKYQSLWRLTEGTVTLTTANSYTLSPAPVRVLSVRYIGTSTNSLPMEELSRDEYFDLPNRTNTGFPHSYYVDRQRSASTLYIWQPLASVTTETIAYTYQRKFEDIDSLDNDIDVRTEWLETVGYNLAYRLGPDFGRVNSIAFKEIKEQAIVLKEEMLDDDREDFVRMVPTYNEQGFW